MYLSYITYLLFATTNAFYSTTGPRKPLISCQRWQKSIINCSNALKIDIKLNIDLIPFKLDVLTQPVSRIVPFCEETVTPFLKCMQNTTNAVFERGLADCTVYTLATNNDHLNALLDAQYHCDPEGGQRSLLENENCIRRTGPSNSRETEDCRDEAERKHIDPYLQDEAFPFTVFRDYNLFLYDCVARKTLRCEDANKSYNHYQLLKARNDEVWRAVYAHEPVIPTRINQTSQIHGSTMQSGTRMGLECFVFLSCLLMAVGSK